MSNLEMVVNKLIEESQQPVDAGGGTGADNARYGYDIIDYPTYIEEDEDGYEEEQYDISAGKQLHVKGWKWPCHAKMGQISNNSAALYSVFVKPHEMYGLEEATEAYFNWLTGPTSPWRSLLDQHNSGSVNGHLIHNNKFRFKHGFVFDKLDSTPNNLIMNFLIASRVPKEWPMNLLRWYEAVQLGIDPAIALLMVSCFRVAAVKYEDLILYDPFYEEHHYTLNLSITDYPPSFHLSDIIHINNFDKYDWPVDAASSDQDYWSNFVHGTPVTENFGPTFKKNSCYVVRSVNGVWGNNSVSKPFLKSLAPEGCSILCDTITGSQMWKMFVKANDIIVKERKIAV